MSAINTSSIFLLALAIAGCTHAKTTETGETAVPEKPAALEKPAATEHSPRRPTAGPPRQDQNPQDDSTPLAMQSSGLLKPGAEQAIRDKLSAGGFMRKNPEGSMKAALRRFQAAHDLPATGAVDHETLRKLGLNPDDWFRQATP